MGFQRKLLDYLEKNLFPLSSTPLLFNQYKDVIAGLDLPDGARIRRENFRNYLRSFPRRPRVVLIGEAVGPHGGRFSGIPFTSERQLAQGMLPFKGKVSSTHCPPYLEYSGNIIWGALLPYFPDFFLWNAVPFLAHKAGKSLSIRKPSRKELDEFSGILKEVLSILNPKIMVAVGRSAEYALRELKLKYIYVRHPSQSGVNEFREGIRKIFSAPSL